MQAWSAAQLPSISNHLVDTTGLPRFAAMEDSNQVFSFVETQCAARLETIRALHFEVKQLRLAHNALTYPGGRTPPELLAEVFSYLLDPALPPSQSADFVHAIATCQSWRDVALGVSRFWTVMNVNSPELTHMYLERSGKRPLFLTLADAPCRDVDAVVALLRPHLSRVKCLTCNSSPAIVRSLLEGLDAPAPILESLYLSFSPQSSPMAELPTISRIFSTNTPSLRYLTLDFVSLSSNALSCASLVELCVRQCFMALHDLLDLLKQCHRLEIFEVEGSNHDSWLIAEDPPSASLIPLPSLRQLRVKMYPIETSFGLLSRIAVPEECSLRMEADICSEMAANEVLELPRLDLAPGLLCLRGLRRLDLLWDDRNGILIRGFRQVDENVDPNVEVILQTAESLFDLPVGEWPFDVSGIELLVVRLRRRDGATCLDSWEMLEDFPRLTTMRLIEGDRQSLGRLLCSLAMVEQLPTERLKCCPDLIGLELVDYPYTAEYQADLMAMCRFRATLGKPLMVKACQPRAAPPEDIRMNED